LKIARLPEHVEQLKGEVERGRRMGTGIEMISPAEASAKNPFLTTTGVLGVIFSPTDLYLEPSQIPNGYAKAAAKLGVTMLPHTLVTGIATRNGAVSGVETEHGTIKCETVVDAAGAWLRAVAALSGAAVRMVPTRHQLLITEPIDGVDAMQPITRVIDVNMMRPACRRGSISLICRWILACCAGSPMRCANNCRCFSVCRTRSSCACTGADCRR
jgi:4-methylaminobutanoate oxidase (formaldehyde-forming)